MNGFREETWTRVIMIDEPMPSESADAMACREKEEELSEEVAAVGRLIDLILGEALLQGCDEFALDHEENRIVMYYGRAGDERRQEVVPKRLWHRIVTRLYRLAARRISDSEGFHYLMQVDKASTVLLASTRHILKTQGATPVTWSVHFDRDRVRFAIHSEVDAAA